MNFLFADIRWLAVRNEFGNFGYTDRISRKAEQILFAFVWFYSYNNLLIIHNCEMLKKIWFFIVQFVHCSSIFFFSFLKFFVKLPLLFLSGARPFRCQDVVFARRLRTFWKKVGCFTDRLALFGFFWKWIPLLKSYSWKLWIAYTEVAK